jgi:hypothetical protein
MNDGTHDVSDHGGPHSDGPADSWQSRAAQAEEQLRDAHDKIASVESELVKAKIAAEQADLRRRIERALADAGALDVDVAGVLVEASLAGTDGPKPTVQAAVQELRKNKAFLFTGRSGATSGGGAGAGSGGAVMSGAVRTDRHASLSELAETARGTGDRGSLLRYLRAKRGR